MPAPQQDLGDNPRKDLTATLSLRSLVRDTNLGLEVIGSADISHRSISWVYVSELPNPGPWLDGGELVLTLGLWLRDGSTSADQYVRRLVASRVSALAVLAGPPNPELATYQEIPSELVAAANAHDLPLLLVPGEITFLTVTKTIAYALASESLARLSEAADAQELLARDAVGRAGLHGMTSRLSTLLNAWVLVIGPGGDILDSTPDSSLEHATSLLPDIRAALRPDGPSVLPLLSAGESVVAYRLQAGHRHRGYLIVGRPAPLSATQRRVANLSSTIMTLMLDREEGELEVSRRTRDSYAQALLRHEEVLAGQLARVIGVELPTGPVYLLAAGSQLAGALPVERAWQILLDALGNLLLAADSASNIAILDASSASVLGRIESIMPLVTDLVVGIAGPAELSELGTIQRQAMAALAEALLSGQRLVEGGHRGQRRLLDLIPRVEARAFAEETLRPLREHDQTQRGDLVRTLRSWLEHYGQWEATSAALGIHRHTLRDRIGRVEKVLGIPLSTPDARMELWAALQLTDETGR